MGRACSCPRSTGARSSCSSTATRTPSRSKPTNTAVLRAALRADRRGHGGRPFVVSWDGYRVSALRLGGLVSWHAPPKNGGSKISEYVIRSIPPDARVKVDGDERVAALRELERGVDYTFSVRARNAAGLGEVSPRKPEPLTVADVPGRPTQLRAACEAGKVAVDWQAPLDAGGTPILGYSVTSKPLGALAPVHGTSTKSVVTRLKPDDSYTFEVRALNEIGLSGASVASEPIVPRQCRAP